MNVREMMETLKDAPPDAPFCMPDGQGNLREVVSLHRERTTYKSEQGHTASRGTVIYVR